MIAPQHKKKRLGQHFLVDQNVIDDIVAAIAPQKDDRLVEIGPGAGALTSKLLPHVKQLQVIEFDAAIIPYLRANCAEASNLIIHQADVLRFAWGNLGNHLRVVGNLPYNISTPLLFLLAKYRNQLRDLCFMLQREVVARMTATPGDKDYGRLSVMIQYYFIVEALFIVPPIAFDPPPQVDSQIVRLIPRTKLPLTTIQQKIFDNLVREAFNHRRKTLANSLKEYFSAQYLQKLGIEPNRRAETLTCAEFIHLATSYHCSQPISQ